MEVIATARGHDGKRLREPGDVFEMPDGSESLWFMPVMEPKAKKAKGVEPKVEETEAPPVAETAPTA